MQKFIKGAFELASSIEDGEKFTKDHEGIIDEVIQYANKAEIGLNFGVTENAKYVCAYHITGATKKFCKGCVSEIRAKLKKEFPKISILYEMSGECLF